MLSGRILDRAHPIARLAVAAAIALLLAALPALAGGPAPGAPSAADSKKEGKDSGKKDGSTKDAGKKDSGKGTAKDSEKSAGKDETGADGSGPDDLGGGEAGSDAGDNAGGGKKPAAKPALSPDEELVKQGLKEFLHPDSLEFLDSGKVHMVFELDKKSEDQAKAFRPVPNSDPQQTFRWSLPGEDSYFRGYGSDRDESYARGLRIGNQGLAYLNCWFKNDVQAEATYIQGTAANVRQQAVLAFMNSSANSLGAGYGSLCGIYSKTSLQKSKGTVEPFVAWKVMRWKLNVAPGTFEAWRDGRVRQKMEYKGKDFNTGRIGFLWAGGVAAFISHLEVTGTIDAAKMAAEMKKK